MSISFKILNINNQFKLEDGKQSNSSVDPRQIKINEKAEEMEALFLTQMVKAMRKTIPKNSWSGTKNENNLSSMMFSSVMGKALAKSGGIGLAKKIASSLQKMDGKEIQELEAKELDQTTMPVSTFNYLKTGSKELNNE